MKKLISFLVLAMALGCGSTDNGNGGQGFSPDPPLEIGGERPALVDIPEDYDPTVSHPLVVVLHGLGPFTGEIQARLLALLDVVEEKDLVMLLPNGTLNEDGNRFWNGASFCCGTDKEAIDDVGYLSGLIEEAKQTYNIDEKRVYLIGHSNGGFMSFRMACETSELITAIVSLAGSTFANATDCQPATLPVSVLAVHGTADTSIQYDGVPDSYPSAVDTVEQFASAAGCDTESPADLGNIDLVTSLDGDETGRVAYTTGCQGGVDAALWTIQEGVHIPTFHQPGGDGPAFGNVVTDWLLEHTR